MSTCSCGTAGPAVIGRVSAHLPVATVHLYQHFCRGKGGIAGSQTARTVSPFISFSLSVPLPPWPSVELLPDPAGSAPRPWAVPTAFSARRLSA